MVTIFFYQENNSEYVNIKFQKLKALKVASDVSTIHPTSRRNNGLVSETRLSTPFNKILATPLDIYVPWKDKGLRVTSFSQVLVMVNTDYVNDCIIECC